MSRLLIYARCAFSFFFYIYAQMLFSGSFENKFQEDALLPLNVKCVFPRNKDILLHNHSMSNKNRNFKINTISILINPQSISKFCQLSPNMTIFFTVQTPVKDTYCSLLSYFLVSFNLEKFLSLSLVFITSVFFRSTDYFLW